MLEPGTLLRARGPRFSLGGWGKAPRLGGALNAVLVQSQRLVLVHWAKLSKQELQEEALEQEREQRDPLGAFAAAYQGMFPAVLAESLLP